MKILGIIPAREGSKRVPQKNFRPFANTTLVDLAIQQGLKSKKITHLAVSSDSIEVLNIARKYDHVYCIERPIELATDEAPAIDYVRHTLKTLEDEEKYDLVVILQPSSPLRSEEDIDQTIELLKKHPEADSSVSVVLVDHMIHPYKLKRLEKDILLPFIEDEAGRFAAHELPDVYVRNCAVYVTWRKNLETRRDVIGQKSVGYVMPADKSVDINTQLDFDFAEFLYTKNEFNK